MNCIEPKPMASRRVRSRKGAFTLIEMLTVIIIIGFMAALALPALKGLTQSNGMTSASRQLLDDVALARQKAILNRCRVYMVFIPPNFWNYPLNTTAYSQLTTNSVAAALRLTLGQYNTYALYAEHAIGDQPGQSSPRYLTKWKTLPDGFIIETNMFRLFSPGSPIPEPELVSDINRSNAFPVAAFTNDHLFVFPPSELADATPQQFYLPYIAFDSQGRLLSGAGRDQFIPLARASVMPSRDLNQQPALLEASVIEPNYREPTRTNYMLVHIDGFTGRGRIEKPELK